MKFKIGDLVKFVPTDIIYDSGIIHTIKTHNGERGNCIGVTIELNHPLFDSSLYYTYKIAYQNGYTAWETEDNLRHLEEYLNKIKDL